MGQSLSIKPLTQSDAALASELQHKVMPNPWTTRQFTDSLAASHICLAAWQAESLVACAVVSLVADEASLLTISTNATCQRQGIGAKLLQALCIESYQSGARHCFLEVMADNEPAIALYKQFGFTQVGLRKGYYVLPDGAVDALVMQCELTETVLQ